MGAAWMAKAFEFGRCVVRMQRDVCTAITEGLSWRQVTCLHRRGCLFRPWIWNSRRLYLAAYIWDGLTMKIPRVTGKLRKATAAYARDPTVIVERAQRTITQNDPTYAALPPSIKSDLMESIRFSAVL